MKVLLTATVQSHICQFHKPLVEVLHEHGCEVHVAAKDNLAEKNGLKLDFVDKVYNVPFARSPRSKDNLKAYKELKKLLNKSIMMWFTVILQWEVLLPGLRQEK
ncbi:hypothetical protein HMPREF0490_01111 [Lachnospiraceae bacterium 6_1_37FAA]|nr:hypothetical protein HMPREF0490_01111 [Lachnospiraceae bacterium 6_1_37FAA]